MKIKSLLFAFLFLLPLALNALTNEEREGRDEILQGWVNQHDDKVDPLVKALAQKLSFKKISHLKAHSSHRHLVALKEIALSSAALLGIPSEQKTADGAVVPLVALYQSTAEGQQFLTADYADELDPLHCRSDIYMKMGLPYRLLFQGKGYPGCARLITLGNGSPLFFEVGTYGGGARCDKKIYTLKQDALKNLAQDLYDHPESLKVATYIQEALSFNVWVKGMTLYQDVEHDGSMEILNCTEVPFPDELRIKLEVKYHQNDNDFIAPFRKTVSVYKWDTTKSEFLDMGDYYF